MANTADRTTEAVGATATRSGGADTSAAPATPPRPAGRLARACETALDAVVVVLASWTVVYHLCLVLRLGVAWAVGLDLAALAAAAAVWLRRGRRPAGRARDADGPASHPHVPARDRDRLERDDPPPAGARAPRWTSVERVAAAGVFAVGAATGVLVAVGGPWPLVAGLWLAAAVGGTVLAAARWWRTKGRQARPHSGRHRKHGTSTGVVVALVWAAALAVLSVFVLRPDADDLYYLNLSQWVVDHGTFPLRDTIFSDLVFPMSSWPPIASYDALVGTLARIAGVPAPSVVYLAVPPVATFLAVLALWRLLATWRLRAVAVALSLALVFLLFDGGPRYANPGNLFLTRMWQGKVLFLCLIVPTLLTYALRYVERPTRARAGWLLAGGVAGVGLTTSAMFLVPAIAVAGAVPLAWRRLRQALTGFAAMAAYPLAAGAVTLLVGGRSADLFDARKLFRFEPAWFGPEIFREGPVAAIAVLAVLAGALAVPHVAARVTVGVLAVIVGVTFVPGVTHLSFDLVGLGPTLWRVSWITPIAALVGVLGSRLGGLAGGRRLGLVGPVALGLVLVVFGWPIWSSAHAIVLDRPHWKRYPGEVAAADQALDAARPGDLILAPEQLAITITVMTTRVKTVAPRSYFMDYLRDDPRFDYAERALLLRFVEDDYDAVAAHLPEVARALTVLDVDQVCLDSDWQRRTEFLRDEGYDPVAQTAAYRCLAR